MFFWYSSLSCTWQGNCYGNNYDNIRLSNKYIYIGYTTRIIRGIYGYTCMIYFMFCIACNITGVIRLKSEPLNRFSQHGVTD